jgi:hypothetical protein
MIDSENKNKGGRPKTWSDDYLKEKLLDFKKKVGNKKFTYTDLEKEYGIKRHIWRDRAEVKALFVKYNEVDIGLDGLDILKYDIELLPNLDEIINETSASRRQKAISQYSDFVNGLYNRCVEYHKYKKQSEEMATEKLTLIEEKKALEKERDFYKNEYFKLTVQSQNVVLREKKGIKDNVIDFNKAEFESDFKDFF